MAKIEIEIDDSVKAELDYIMMFADKDKNFYYEDIGSVLSYLATAWADAGRRPGSWKLSQILCNCHVDISLKLPPFFSLPG